MPSNCLFDGPDPPDKKWRVAPFKGATSCLCAYRALFPAQQDLKSEAPLVYSMQDARAPPYQKLDIPTFRSNTGAYAHCHRPSSKTDSYLCCTSSPLIHIFLKVHLHPLMMQHMPQLQHMISTSAIFWPPALKYLDAISITSTRQVAIATVKACRACLMLIHNTEVHLPPSSLNES
jgi:hypothetical protein